MKKPRKNYTAGIISSILFFTLSCNYLVYKDEVRTTIGEGYYLIERDTIIDFIKANEVEDIFITPTTMVEAFPPSIDQTVKWSLADYLLVAEAFHEQHWGVSTNNWKLNHIDTSMKCTDISEGPQYVFFEYFHNVKSQGETSRLVHRIYIQPAKNIVYWDEIKYDPANIKWKTIDLPNTKISYENALQIAEENGGGEIRKNVDNNCNVEISLRPGSQYNGWTVSYKYGLDRTLIVIDTHTGKYRIFR